MRIKRIVVGALETNCYIISCEETGEAVVVDPGAEPDRVLRETQGLEVVAIVDTHGHYDHVGANGQVKKATGADVWIHPSDGNMLTDGNLNGSAMFLGAPVTVPPADRFLGEGEEIRFGRLSMRAIHTPGHSPGSASLFVDGHLFCGDVLFRGSVGRWDLPGGSFGELMRSITEKLLPLGDDVVVHPGHGPETTIGWERRYNPFLTDGTFVV